MRTILSVLVLSAGSSAVATFCEFKSTPFADMHDGDFKAIEVAESNGVPMMTILPYNNTESWQVKAQVDADSCTAVVDFRVDGKPNPPPCSLKATINKLVDAKANFRYSIVFTDTSGAITDDPTLPLNAWLALD